MEEKNQSLWVGIAALVVIIVAYFGIYPLMNDIKQVRAQVAGKRLQADKLESKVDQLKQLNTQFTSRAGDLERLRLALPAEAKAEEIFVMVDSLARDASLELSNMQPQAVDPNQASTASSVTISTTVVGDYAGITAFTDGLKNNVRPVSIKNVSIVSEKMENGTVKLNATYVLDFLVAKAAPAPVDAAQEGGE